MEGGGKIRAHFSKSSTASSGTLSKGEEAASSAGTESSKQLKKVSADARYGFTLRSLLAASVLKQAAISASARTLLWSSTPRALSSLQRLAPLSCSGPTTRTLPFSCRGRTSTCGVGQPMGGVALIPPLLSAPCCFAGLYPSPA